MQIALLSPARSSSSTPFASVALLLSSLFFFYLHKVGAIRRCERLMIAAEKEVFSRVRGGFKICLGRLPDPMNLFSARNSAFSFRPHSARKREDSCDMKINGAKRSFHSVGAVRSFIEFHTADVLILLTGSIEK